MAERWIQIGAALLCGLGSCAANPQASTKLATQPGGAASTQSVALHPAATEIHEPVPPPPPPMPGPPVVQPVTTVTTAKSTATQPVEPPPVIATTEPGPIDERVAYAIGYSAGRRIHDRLEQDGRTADPLLVLKGLIDGLGDRDPAYPRQDVQAAFAEFQAYTLQRRAEKMYADNPAFRKRADENLKKSRAILDQNAEIAGVDVRPDGVQVQLLAGGDGKIVGNARVITVKNLRVSLADGTLVKASDPDQTDAFAAGDALNSLMDVIRGMKIGGKARVWLPPDKAYGLTGKPPVVGPNQGIEYEFELVGVE